MIVCPVRGFANVQTIANAIVGPFFNREEATRELEGRRYEYGKNAIVWCASGYHSGSYRNAIDEQENRAD